MATFTQLRLRNRTVAAIASVTFALVLLVEPSHAFGLTFTSIDVPGATQTDALGINDRGIIVGDCVIGGSFHGFVLNGGTFSLFDVPGATGTFGIAINNWNQIAGYWLDDLGTLHGFSLEAGIFTMIDVPEASSTFAIGIDQRGGIVGGFTDSAGATHGFTFEAGHFTLVDVPGATYTEVDGANAGFVAKLETESLRLPQIGQVVGDYVDCTGMFHGFLFLLDRGILTTIDVPGAKFTETIGINSRGQIVGSYDDLHGYLLDHGVFTTLDVPGSVLTKATKLNNRDEIVGFYTDASGLTHGFLAR